MNQDQDGAAQHPASPYYSAQYAARQPKDLTALGILAFATAALATASTCLTASVLGRAVRIRAEQGRDAYDWSLGLYYAGELLTSLSLLAGFVTGSMWLHRARRNAEVMEPSGVHRRRAGWAWGGWVTPVVALWFPFQVVRDVRRALTPLSTAGLVGFWWTLFLVSEVLAWNSQNLQSAAFAQLQYVELARVASIVGAAVTIAALVGWGQVLRAVTLEQHQRMYAGR